MEDSRWLDADEMRAWMAFLETSHLLQRRIDLQLREAAGLTQPQYELLTRLSEAPGRRRRMAELADLLVTSRSGLTYQVDQLVKAGLVAREPCESDDRGVVATLTTAGAEKLQLAAPGHVSVVRKHLVDLLTRDEMAVLTSVFERSRASLRGVTGARSK